MIPNASSQVGSLLTALLPAVLLSCLLLLPSHTAVSASVYSKDQPEVVKAVVNRTARIPCLVPLSEDDKIIIIMWSKEGIDGNVFSVDMRGPGEPRQIISQKVFGARAQFELEDYTVYLRLEELEVGDAGHYKCQMDIIGMRTQVAEAILKVIVPPGEPTILSEDGREVHHELGPYNEGTTVNITCRVKGGQPSPRVSWYEAERVLDEAGEQCENQVVCNTLSLGPLTRQHLGARYLCQAFNSDQVGPRQKEVKLKMYLKPLTVKMDAPTHPLVVGRVYNITCESREGLPPADITWWLLGEKIDESLIVKETRGNVSLSTLTFRPEIQHEGENLKCHAQSPKINHKALVDSTRLRVQYAPEVMLELASGIDLHNVREGDNVTLVCQVKANPKASSTSWYHKLMEVDYDASPNIVRGDTTLQLRNVSRKQSGPYTCHAANTIGSGESDPIVLKVMYVPFCKESKVIQRGAAKQDNVELKCDVRGSPDNITFSWYYLTPGGRVRIPEESYTTRDLTSVLTYTVHDDDHYRDVTCYGENEVGIMRDPCRFEVIPAGKPDPLENCTVYNQTSEALFVTCLLGYDGGLKQHFVAQVFEDVEGIRLNILNFTETSQPIFTIGSLRPGTEYLLSMYAENEKGKSEERKIYGFTLPPVGRPVHIFPITPVLGVLIGVVGALVLVALVVVVVMRIKGDTRQDRILRHVAAEGVKLPHASLPPPKDDGTYENVDSIPPKLKHANIYETVPYDKEKSSNNEDSEKDDVEYAELTFNNGKNKNKSNKKGGGPGGANGVIRTADDSTIYATIDHKRTETQNQNQKPPQPPPALSPQQQQYQQQANKQAKQKKQVYIAQPGTKTGKHSVGDPNLQPPREPDEIPLMDAALESSV